MAHKNLPGILEGKIDRRGFLGSAGKGAMVLAMPFPVLPDFLKNASMGIVVHSYASRWHSKSESEKFPAFTDAVSLMEHCKSIGAGGVQVTVAGWSQDFGNKVRAKREELDMYLEGSIGLPQDPGNVPDFEREVIIAREAGASILRTACLSGRRYTNFMSKEDFLTFKKKAIKSMELAEPIMQKHKMKLAVENHKDWTAQELKQIIQSIGSEWVGVTLDFGNNVSFMENPMEVIETLAPYAFSTHVKDMGVKNYEDGFLLSEVPLGEGIVDLKSAVALCKKHNPKINFSLEMITRDPLEIPCMKDSYWTTFDHLSGLDVYKMDRMLGENQFKRELPKVTGLTQEERLAFEEQNILECINYSRKSLKL
ncbi:sugar phosphate isomerase/epimerase [Algoriphagus sp. AGSA1]|uniref:sugar phosphate isomerase/epimerase family protein n=1 Tax=Algoriphagus sp. AGSA1 TaxID=2907213 RepID=UPI001F2FD0A4|nr:TIM barrel protein [Algoriphagus sp. AGSA1]MCE7053361.1 sugar phosphate isomerase/epimerase [Algoriphagus sp. AGSA1]